MAHLFQMRQHSIQPRYTLPFPLIRELFSHRSFSFYQDNPCRHIFMAYYKRILLTGDNYFYCRMLCVYVCVVSNVLFYGLFSVCLGLGIYYFRNMLLYFTRYCLLFLLRVWDDIYFLQYMLWDNGTTLNDPSNYIMIALKYE